MSFLDNTITTLNEALIAINGYAFGDNHRFNFMGRPIGLFTKSYHFMLKHLYRNIGNVEYTYDGFGTPIGELANPYYNTFTILPWFKSDDFKKSASNYIEYIRNIYGSTLSVENINSGVTISISDENIVGAIDTGVFFSNAENGVFSANPNGLDTDTKKSENDAKKLYKTLYNAFITNEKRDSEGFSITKNIRTYFGAKDSAINNNDIFNISSKRDNNTGRYITLNPLDIQSPIGSYGTLGDIESLGGYSEFYESLSEKQQGYLKNNININRYYPKLPNEDGNTYFQRMLMVQSHEASIDAVNESQARYVFTLESNAYAHTNVRDAVLGDVYVYAENESGNYANHISRSFNAGVNFGRYSTYSNTLAADDLLKKTNDAFRAAKYGTLIARFHTGLINGENLKNDISQTAISEKYGLSHGRNLLKKTPDESEGYDNPYCRVWTYHHQYHRLLDAIRPFGSSDRVLYADKPISAQHGEDWGDGRTRLSQLGVINPVNGLVNITPTDGRNGKVDIKNCMFSIENLAWKDAAVNDLDDEQKGPFGGRIMWFPPYDISFSESVNVDWGRNEFIGRGEPIYTYSNTTRSGNLRFMLLIDHPSILNYWENRGKSLTNSVDVVDDAEQNLLRFFAGCDDLSDETINEPPSEPEVIIHDDPIPTPNTRELRFYVFYPNNYSGINDDPNYAIEYLLNGVGTWKTEGGRNINIPFAPINVERIRDNNNAEYGECGGYEVRPGLPISLGCCNSTATGNCDNAKNEHIMNITNVGGVTQNIKVYVQKGANDSTWWKRKYYYRVDKAYENQILQRESYIDRESHGLNSSVGRENILKTYAVNEEDLFSLADVYVALHGDENGVLDGYYDPERADTFKEIISGCSGILSVSVVGKASVQGYKKSNNNLQRNRAITVSKWLQNSPLFRSKLGSNEPVCTVGGTGGAGKGINKGNASSLPNKIYRCAEVIISVKTESTETLQSTQKDGFTETTGTVDGGMMVQTRYVQGDTSLKGGGSINRNFNDISANSEFAIKRAKSIGTDLRLRSLNNNIGNFILNLKESQERDEVSLNGVFDAIGNLANNMRADEMYIREATASTLSNILGSMASERIPNANVVEMHDNSIPNQEIPGNDQISKADAVVSGVGNNGSVAGGNERVGGGEKRRFGNEGRFFELLSKEEPFLHSKISDKIKYFDPAFHSVSPEGFNARLTFLHQCTRQGPTIASSDSNLMDSTANNLSFGRPPVCILRIGDFYYTKILIRNFTIDYDPMVWDFNHEGIGVMPMMARVNMSFEFLGGSSLGGHISRLQNALSFNYYANTEVYDNRTELATYDNDGKIKNFKSFIPS